MKKIAVFLLFIVIWNSSLKRNQPLTIAVKKKDFIFDIEVQGKIQPAFSTTIVYKSRWDSFVTKIVPEGSLVKKGDIVIEFEERDLRYQVKEMQLYLRATELEKQVAVAELEAEQQKIQLLIEKSKTDIAITDLLLQELKNPPQEELEMAIRRYEQAKKIMDIAKKHHGVFQSTQNKTLFTMEEFHKLETSLQQTCNSYLVAKKQLEFMQRKNHPLAIEQIKIEKEKKELFLKSIYHSIPSALESFKREVEQVAEKVNSIRRHLETAQDDLRAAKLRSPMDGLVVYNAPFGKKIAIGNNYWLGVPLLKVANIHKMEFHATISEKQAPYIRKDLLVTIFIEGFYQESFSGRVKKIGKIALDRGEQERGQKSGEKVFVVVIEMDRKEKVLLPNISALGKIHIKQKKNALVIPNFSIWRKNNKTFVWLSKKGRYVKKEVVVEIDNGYETVISGLNLNDKVVVK